MKTECGHGPRPHGAWRSERPDHGARHGIPAAQQRYMERRLSHKWPWTQRRVPQLCAATLCTNAFVPGNIRTLRMPIRSHTNLIPFPSRAKIACTLDFTCSPALESGRPPPCSVERYPMDGCQQEVHVYFARGNLHVSAYGPHQHCMERGRGACATAKWSARYFRSGRTPLRPC